VGPGEQAETPPVIVRRPSEAPAESPSEGGGSHTMARAGFWVAVVATVGSAALGLKFARDVQQINSELDPYRRYPCAASASGCNLQGDPKQALTPNEKSIVSDKTDHGKQDQLLEEIFLIGAVPFAIAGGYFLYKGYLDSGSEKTTASRGLRIFPTVSASAGGIVTEFDF